MKAYKKYIMILAAAPMLWACSAEEGSEPGSDPNPAVTVYCYTPSDQNLNPDNDVMVRFVTNNKTTSVKYLALPTAEVTSTLNNGGEKALLDKVESEGIKIENLGGNEYADVVITDLHGDYTITAVANGSSLANRVKFFGLDWKTIKEGTFFFESDIVPIEASESALEVCTSNSKLYHLKDVFGEGHSLKLNMLDVTGEDDLGKFTLFRVASQRTPWSAGDYGQVSVYDVGYWQGNEAYVTSETEYANYLYESGRVDVCLVWYVGAGALGFGYSYFIPND